MNKPLPKDVMDICAAHERESIYDLFWCWRQYRIYYFIIVPWYVFLIYLCRCFFAKYNICNM